MKILLVGGPYDGQGFDIEVDRKGKPVLDVLYMPRRTTIAEGCVEHLAGVPDLEDMVLRYLLIEAPVPEWSDGRWRYSPTKWFWEYHYEG
ncbi:hypothetical protein [Raoultella ornithinolytica]|uniref:hypothetical protein n=1 Tax=Raoultella ornithinolytica TaxID=54291 RepID=UPI0012DB257C|nr:hypothetical protein [Raoultella ornithinolytica]